MKRLYGVTNKANLPDGRYHLLSLSSSRGTIIDIFLIIFVIISVFIIVKFMLIFDANLFEVPWSKCFLCCIFLLIPSQFLPICLLLLKMS